MYNKTPSLWSYKKVFLISILLSIFDCYGMPTKKNQVTASRETSSSIHPAKIVTCDNGLDVEIAVYARKIKLFHEKILTGILHKKQINWMRVTNCLLGLVKEENLLDFLARIELALLYSSDIEIFNQIVKILNDLYKEDKLHTSNTDEKCRQICDNNWFYLLQHDSYVYYIGLLINELIYNVQFDIFKGDMRKEDIDPCGKNYPVFQAINLALTGDYAELANNFPSATRMKYSISNIVKIYRSFLQETIDHNEISKLPTPMVDQNYHVEIIKQLYEALVSENLINPEVFLVTNSASEQNFDCPLEPYFPTLSSQIQILTYMCDMKHIDFFSTWPGFNHDLAILLLFAKIDFTEYQICTVQNTSFTLSSFENLAVAIIHSICTKYWDNNDKVNQQILLLCHFFEKGLFQLLHSSKDQQLIKKITDSLNKKAKQGIEEEMDTETPPILVPIAQNTPTYSMALEKQIMESQRLLVMQKTELQDISQLEIELTKIPDHSLYKGQLTATFQLHSYQLIDHYSRDEKTLQSLINILFSNGLIDNNDIQNIQGISSLYKKTSHVFIHILLRRIQNYPNYTIEKVISALLRNNPEPIVIDKIKKIISSASPYMIVPEELQHFDYIQSTISNEFNIKITLGGKTFNLEQQNLHGDYLYRNTIKNTLLLRRDEIMTYFRNNHWQVIDQMYKKMFISKDEAGEMRMATHDTFADWAFKKLINPQKNGIFDNQCLSLANFTVFVTQILNDQQDGNDLRLLLFYQFYLKTL